MPAEAMPRSLQRNREQQAAVIWNLINTLLAGFSLGVAVTLWHRTVVAETPVVDTPEAEHEGPACILHLRIRNPGRHTLMLETLRFRSPARSEVCVYVRGERGVRTELDCVRRQQQLAAPDVALLDWLVEPGGEAVFELTLHDLEQPLDASLHWAKHTPVILPSRPTRVRRTREQLSHLADARGGGA
jgi:hypothetical protein